jgi:hypothetical protein
MSELALEPATVQAVSLLLDDYCQEHGQENYDTLKARLQLLDHDELVIVTLQLAFVVARAMQGELPTEADLAECIADAPEEGPWPCGCPLVRLPVLLDGGE